MTGRRPPQRRVSRVAALTTAVLLPGVSLLTGCAAGAGEETAGHHHGAGASPTAAAAAPSGSPGDATAGGTGTGTGSADEDTAAVRVGLTEWSIAVAVPSVAPGEVTFLVTNAGGTEHDLLVSGQLGRWHTPDLDPGERTELTVQAKPGERLRLWCSLPGHEVQGMHTTLPVRAR